MLYDSKMKTPLKKLQVIRTESFSTEEHRNEKVTPFVHKTHKQSHPVKLKNELRMQADS